MSWRSTPGPVTSMVGSASRGLTANAHRGRGMRTSAFIALIVIVAIGCSSPAGSAAPSDTSPPLPSPSTATASNSAPVSAEPSAPATSTPISPSPSTASAPTDLARIAVEERDNIRVEVELQRNPLPAGEPSWVKVRVTNKGRTNVTWFHDGCAEPVWVHGVSEVAWSMGEEHRGRQGCSRRTPSAAASLRRRIPTG